MSLKSFACAMVAGTVICAGAQAATIRVSKESYLGAGDFDTKVVGFIQSFSTSDSIASFYSFADPVNWSYNNNEPHAVKDTTQFFFVEASDGLAFVTVHDAINDGSGGHVDTIYTFVDGGSNKTRYAVLDDTGGNDSYTKTENNGDLTFTTYHTWKSCCTDGVAFNNLGDTFTIFADLTSSSGLGNMIATSYGGSTLGLGELPTNGRVRFDFGTSFVETGISTVPVPPAGLLLIGGLGALGAMRARRKQSK